MTTVGFPPVTPDDIALEYATRDVTVKVERLPDGRLALILPESFRKSLPESLPRFSQHHASLLDLRDEWRLRVDLSFDFSDLRGED